MNHKYKVVHGSDHRLYVAMVKRWYFPFWMKLDRFEYARTKYCFDVIKKHNGNK